MIYALYDNNTETETSTTKSFLNSSEISDINEHKKADIANMSYNTYISCWHYDIV